jgi:hypothetical protein
MIKLKLILDQYLRKGYVIIDENFIAHSDGGIFFDWKTYIMQKID